jgi:hypothetical protein
MLRKPEQHQMGIARKAEEFCVEYDPLEYLLVCIMDGARKRKDRPRQTNLTRAYEAITGLHRERVDLPDSEVGVALAEYMRQDELNRENQLIPEEGGPTVVTVEDEHTYRELQVNGIAKLAVESAGDLSGNLLGYVSERVLGTYRNDLLQDDPEGYWSAQFARYVLHDRAAERQLYADMKAIAAILEKHGVKLDLTRPFWRVAPSVKS